ncbi:MAG: hypothetical protein KF760_22045 [Candidatus Eremiobacteraeota bacterium]|nr:hypothetical protein [Candidatus Eremiobacteraeota bacterium]MCW5866555.1 hypothetical protein [Candidatus Eremiobacteraeota bacterium]
MMILHCLAGPCGTLRDLACKLKAPLQRGLLAISTDLASLRRKADKKKTQSLFCEEQLCGTLRNLACKLKAFCHHALRTLKNNLASLRAIQDREKPTFPFNRIFFTRLKGVVVSKYTLEMASYCLFAGEAA